jgi:hypothetical protein
MISNTSRLQAMIFVFLPIFALILFGCPQATITPSHTPSTSIGTAGRPQRIVVYPFEVSAEHITENQGPIQRALRATKSDDEQRQGRLKTGLDVANELAQDLVKGLQGLGFNAESVPRGTPVSGEAMIIDGRILNANEGNRARQVIIGFGVGASSLETEVNVSQVSAGGTLVHVMSFKTHADSGKMPGAALTMGVGGAAQGVVAAGGASVAQGAVKTYTSMLSRLADNSTKQITAYLSQYFAAKGWISSDQAQKVSMTK